MKLAIMKSRLAIMKSRISYNEIEISYNEIEISYNENESGYKGFCATHSILRINRPYEFSLYNNVHVRRRERIFFLYRKKRVIEVEGFHLNYTLFPSNKIYKENKQHK